MGERTVADRATELQEAANSAGMALRDDGAGVFGVLGAWSSLCLIVSVNHDDGFMVSRKFWGKGKRWRRMGFWKHAKSAVRAASYYTDKPIEGWRPRRF